jgi:hypothetical protein
LDAEKRCLVIGFVDSILVAICSYVSNAKKLRINNIQKVGTITLETGAGTVLMSEAVGSIILAVAVKWNIDAHVR